MFSVLTISSFSPPPCPFERNWIRSEDQGKERKVIMATFTLRERKSKNILSFIFSKTQIIFKIHWPYPRSVRGGKDLCGQTDLWSNMLSLSNKELVMLNSQSLGFLIYKVELILNSFSYSEDKMKGNYLQRTAQILTCAALVVRLLRHSIFGYWLDWAFTPRALWDLLVLQSKSCMQLTL